MSAAKDAVRRAYQAYETGDLAVLDAVIAADYFDHNPIEGQGPGLDGAKQKLAGTFEQLSGVRVEILDQIEEGDRVASRIRLTASADGTAVAVDLIVISQVVDGRIVAEWGQSTTTEG